MSAIASQITSFTLVYTTIYSDAHQRKDQSSASLAFVWGIHRRPVNSPHKGPVTRKMFPFDDVIMFVARWLINPAHGIDLICSWYFICVLKLLIHNPDYWGRHQMETFSALLAFCEGNRPVTGGFPSQRPVTRSFDVFFDLRLNMRFGYTIETQMIWDAIELIITSL